MRKQYGWVLQRLLSLMGLAPPAQWEGAPGRDFIMVIVYTVFLLQLLVFCRSYCYYLLELICCQCPQQADAHRTM